MTEVEAVAELITYSCKECYVYVPLPPATSYGHRAENWDVDNWFKALSLKVVSWEDFLGIRLLDPDTGELFAECPLPADGTSLTTAVEPVVDSSRYYVLKVVDKATKNHAFVGLGFRDRGASSDFSAALDEYRQYLRRKREADEMKQEHEQKEHEGTDSQTDFSLKPGQTIKLNISTGMLNRAHSQGMSSGSLFRGGITAITPNAAGLLKLQPPPAPAPTTSVSQGGTKFHQAENFASQGSEFASLAPVSKRLADADDWGDFVG